MPKNRLSSDEKMWQRRSDVSTIQNYAELMSNPKRMKDAVTELNKQQKAISKVVPQAKKKG